MDLTTTEAEAAKLWAACDHRIDSTRLNKGLSDGGKRSLIAAAVKECSDALERLRTETVEAAEAERAGLERKLWANTDPADVTGYRDALARARALKRSGRSERSVLRCAQIGR